MIADHGSVFAAEIELLARHIRDRLSGLCRTGALKRSIDRGELGLIIRAAGTQQQRFDGLEVNLRLNSLASCAADVGNKKIPAARIVARLVHILPVDSVSGYINR